jgi:hypothetical protein
MSSTSIDYIVYCRKLGRNTTFVGVRERLGAEFRDPFPSEDLVSVVDLGDLDRFEMVPPILVSYSREGPRSDRVG